MDPNACLEELLDLCREVIANAEADDDEANAQLAPDLAEHVQNLNDWIAKGGSLPDRWKK